MAFSLSPSVDVREYDLSLTVPNIPSSKTGMVLRADKGPCFKITPITNERELVDTFGPPTNHNYQDWFQAWNFLQYSQSLYIVRPTGVANGEITVENAAIALENDGSGNLLTTKGVDSYANFYNSDAAELAMETLVPSARLTFINKNVTSNQKFAVAVCSEATFWNSPIANPSGAKIGVLDATAPAGSTVIDFGESTFALADNFTVDGTSYEIVDTTDILTDDYVDSGFNLAVTMEIGDDTAVTDLAVDFVATDQVTIGGELFTVASLFDATTVVFTGTATAQHVAPEDILVNEPFVSNVLSTVAPALQVGLDAGAVLMETPAAEPTASGLFDESIEDGNGNVRTFAQFFEYEPDWASGEFAVIVLELNSDGQYAQFGDEAFIVNWNENGRDSEGRNTYAKEYFFNRSKALYAIVDPTATNPVNTSYSPIASLESTVDSVYPQTAGEYDPDNYDYGDITYGWDLFNDPESFDINILVAHPLELVESAVQWSSQIAASRKDCVSIVAPYEYDKLVGKSASQATQYLLERYGTQTAYANKVQKVFNSYTAMYGNMKYQYDRFNDVNRWIGIGGDIAGLAAQVDANRDPWWAIAGLDRGKVKNVIKVAFNPNKANRDDLYVNAINPVINIPGEGSGIVFGQKTATAKPSAFDRLNVRRLLIYLEKAIATACRYMLFEFNDEFTRARIRGLIEPFLRDVKGRRGIYDFRVVCDESNNTGEVIDKNGLVIDVYIKPTRVAEFIQLNMKVVRTDANFEEIIGG